MSTNDDERTDAQREQDERFAGRARNILDSARTKGLAHKPLADPALDIVGDAYKFGELISGKAWTDGKSYDGDARPPAKTIRDVADAVADGVRQSIIDGAHSGTEKA